MRSRRAALILATTLAAAAIPGAARADVGLGIFVGEPTGLDLKIDIEQRSALDFVLGLSSFRDGRVNYGHFTYLVTPFIGRGRSVLVPLRLGIGVAVYDVARDVDVAVRAPLELGFRFRSAPIELYGEIALVIPFVRDVRADLDGGLGFRIYF
jgi:hypothetical protein